MWEGYLVAEMFLSGVCLHLTYDDSQYLLLYEIYQDEEMPLMLSKETIGQQCCCGQQSLAPSAKQNLKES